MHARHSLRLLGAALLSLPWALPAAAASYQQLEPEQSRLNFTYQQMGVPMEGQFRKFDGQLNFDPAVPEQGKAVIEVDLSSIDTGLPEADSEVTGQDWFAVAEYPVARFESHAIRAAGDSNYEVDGTLSIRGQSRELTIPATFKETNDRGVFSGNFTLLRGDFGIGQGMWSGFDMVANEVQVNFELSALPAAGTP